MSAIETKLAEEKAKLEAIQAEQETAWQAYRALSDNPAIKIANDAWLKLYEAARNQELRVRVLEEMEAGNK